MYIVILDIFRQLTLDGVISWFRRTIGRDPVNIRTPALGCDLWHIGYVTPKELDAISPPRPNPIAATNPYGDPPYDNTTELFAAIQTAGVPGTDEPAPPTAHEHPEIVRAVEALEIRVSQLEDLLDAPEPPPPPSGTRALVGLHLRTSGLDHNAPEFAGELDLIRRGRIQAVKFTSNSTFESLDALLNVVKPENIVIRLYMAGNDSNLSNPDTFWFYLRAWVQFAVSRGVLRFEIHNEPNLSSEGLGSAWANAAGFAWWYEKVRAAIKSEFPSALVGFPSLSPQPNVDEWLAACAGVIGKSDWVGAHSYWQTEDQMTQAEHGAYWQRYVQFGKPIYITEFANVSNVMKHEKGVQYVRYYDMLRAPVVAAFSFVSSAPGGDFPEQTWAGSDIADTVGARGW